MTDPAAPRPRRVAATTWRGVAWIGLWSGALWGATMLALSAGPFARVVPTGTGVVVVARDRSLAETLALVGAWSLGGAAFGASMAAVLALVARGARRVATAALRGEGPLALAPGEALLEDGPANRLGSLAASGGWLYLTDRRLVFLPHRLNLGLERPASLALADVAGAEAGTTWRVVPNALVVHRVDGGVERFVVGVQARHAWAAAVLAACGLPPGPPLDPPPAAG